MRITMPPWKTRPSLPWRPRVAASSSPAAARTASRASRFGSLLRRGDGSIHPAAGLSFLAYDAGFRGGVRVATGDVNRDGVPDIITAPGLGGGSRIRVFDSTSGAPLGGPLSDFDAYGSKYQDGVFVAAGDVNGDGFADIITGPQGGRQVKVFSGADGSLLAQLRPYGRGFIKSVHVAAGDVNGDGKADLILGPSGGAEKPVKVFDAVTLNLLYSFFPFDRGYLKGLYVDGQRPGRRRPHGDHCGQSGRHRSRQGLQRR